MNTEDVILILSALVLIGVIIFMIIWVGFRAEVVVVTNQPLQGSVGIGYSCLNDEQSCNEGLFCDFATNTCKVPLGEKCFSYADCQIGSFCSGVCVQGEFGGPNEPCPCDIGLECVQLTTFEKVCKGVSGYTCNTNEECASGVCQSGTCTSGLGLGVLCDGTFQCEGGTLGPTSGPGASGNYCSFPPNVDFGFCEPVNTIVGNTGAVCFLGQPVPGTTGATGAGCNPGNLCLGGFCAAAVNGLGMACGTNAACAPPLSCLTVQGNTCFGATGGCMCLFQDNPNLCSVEVCMTDFLCDLTTNQCLAENEQACVVNADCLNNNCSISNSMFKLIGNATYGNTVNCPGVTSNTSFLTATVFQWEPFSTLPPNATVNRLTGYSSSATSDVIYAVASDGLYFSTGPGWSLIIESPLVVSSGGITSTKILVDAVATSTMILVGFNETQTGGPTPLSDYTLYILTNNNTLTPFNVNSSPDHIDGAQYQSLPPTTSIIFSQIDISTANDVMLLSGTTPLVKPSAQVVYSMRFITQGNTITTTPINTATRARFYFDIPENQGGVIVNFPPDYNLSYTAPMTDSFGDHGIILQANGNIPGYVSNGEFFGPYYPKLPRLGDTPDQSNVIDYSIFSPTSPPCYAGAKNSTIIMVGEDTTHGLISIFHIVYGSQYILPGFANQTNRVLATAGNVYLYSQSSCS